MEDQPLRLPPTEPEGELTFLCSWGGGIDEVALTLRFMGDDLDPDEITSRLGVSPTFACRKGQITRKKIYDKIEKTGKWLHKYSRVPEVNLVDQIKRMLVEMSSDLSIWQDLTSRFNSDLFAGLYLFEWNRELVLPPDIMRMISDRGLHLFLDIYYEGREEEEEEGDKGDAWKEGQSETWIPE